MRLRKFRNALEFPTLRLFLFISFTLAGVADRIYRKEFGLIKRKEKMSLPKEKKSALYCRVSTLDQATGLESQIRALKDWCHRNQITNYELFCDEGISGAKENRPALNRMMEMVDENKLEQVVVFSFSRFARSTSHLLKALKTFKEKETRFISITEAIDTNSPLGVALYTILGALAQLEREMICERVRAGMANAKAKGKKIGRTKMRNSSLIRQLLDAGLSFREIARIAKCSHGSIYAEKVAYKKEKEAEEKSRQAVLAEQAKELQAHNQMIEDIVQKASGEVAAENPQHSLTIFYEGSD